MLKIVNTVLDERGVGRSPDRRRQPKGTAAELERYAAALHLRLSERQAQIAVEITEDRSRTDVAGRLGISIHTVNSHVERIFVKLGIKSCKRLAALLEREVLLTQNAEKSQR